MTKRELILKEIRELPDSILDQIFEFAQFLRAKKKKESDFFCEPIALEDLAAEQRVDKIKDFEKLLGSSRLSLASSIK